MLSELFFGPHVQIALKKPQDDCAVVFFTQELAFSLRIPQSLMGHSFTLATVLKLVTKD